ncbi:hypothetical protein E2C01_029057 [Portunus trituberculatus]|uniref:Uncharacterized protein n=1 Tax=Portunus trituberculatus TaxID=210409 RepID=A0A5B7EMD4_PORTR|nr:hypothetical protein [Portunus trituberculatus]
MLRVSVREARRGEARRSEVSGNKTLTSGVWNHDKQEDQTGSDRPGRQRGMVRRMPCPTLAAQRPVFANAGN